MFLITSCDGNSNSDIVIIDRELLEIEEEQIANAENDTTEPNLERDENQDTADNPPNTEDKKEDFEEEKDTTPPQIYLRGASQIKLNVGVKFEEPGVEYSDESNEVILEVFGSVDESIPGKYLIVYRATDKSGNSTTVERQVEVVDNIPPVIISLKDDSLNIEWKSESNEATTLINQYIDNNYECSDNDICTIESIMPGGFNTDEKRKYNIIIRALDRVGQYSETTLQVIIIDTTPPNVRLYGPSEIDIPYGQSWEDPGLIVDEPVSEYTIYGLGISTFQLGRFVINYEVTDRSGNTTKISRTVNIFDDTPPVLSLLGLDEIGVEVGNSLRDPGVSITENTKESPEITYTHDYPESDIFNQRLNRVGIYTITYSAKDSSGNISNTVSRKIRVFDSTPPTLKFFNTNNPTKYEEYFKDSDTPDRYYDLESGNYIFYSDNSSDELTIDFDDGGFNRFEDGTYTFKYSVTDQSGNRSEIRRIVEVKWSPYYNPLKEGKIYRSASSIPILPDRFYYNSVNLITGNESVNLSTVEESWNVANKVIYIINTSPTGILHEFTNHNTISNQNAGLIWSAISDLKDEFGVNNSYNLDEQFTYVKITRGSGSDDRIIYDFLDESGERNKLFKVTENNTKLSSLAGESMILLDAGLNPNFVIDEDSILHYELGEQIVFYSYQKSYNIISEDRIIIEGTVSGDLNILTKVGEFTWSFNNPLS